MTACAVWYAWLVSGFVAGAWTAAAVFAVVVWRVRRRVEEQLGIALLDAVTKLER